MKNRLKMDYRPALISLITFSLFFYGVNPEDLGCPFNQAVPKELQMLNLSLVDLLNGDLLLNKNPTSLEQACKKTDFDGLPKVLKNALDNCNYGGTKPQVQALNLKGAKEAIQYMCKNIKVFKDNAGCFNSSQEDLKTCRDKMTKTAKEKNKTPLENTCSAQRIHSFCAEEVVKKKCGEAAANYKKEIAGKLLSPQCACGKQVVERMSKGNEMLQECFSSSCIHNGIGFVKEQDVGNGIVFGYRSTRSIEMGCAFTDDQKDYKLSADLKSCLNRECSYPYKAYKLKLINAKGMMDAAQHICKERNNVMGTEESRRIMDSLLRKTVTCQVEKIKAEEERLDDMDKLDDMNVVVCSNYEITRKCIEDNFNCATCKSLREYLLKNWDLRKPAFCNKCTDIIGYQPVKDKSTAGGPTGGSGVIVVQSLAVILISVFLTLIHL